MKKFIIKTLLLLVLFYSLFYLVYWSLPYYWANEGLSSKMKFWKQSKKDFNAVFIGSSRTQMHIMPSVFDSINVTCKIKSFNLGYGANSAEEILYLTENLIHSKESNHLKYIFVEVRPIWYNPDNLFTARGKYILNLKEYRFLSNYYSKTTYKYAKNDYKKALVEKLLGIGLIRDVFVYYFSTKKSFLVGVKEDGFTNRTTAIQNDKLNKLLKEEGNDIEKLKESLALRIQFASNSYENLYDVSDEDSLYVKRLEKLKKQAQEKDITLLYYPTIRFENTNLPALLHTIDANGTFNQSSNPSVYPELYELSYSGDASHLNEEGAFIYSRILAQLFNENFCQ